MRPVPYILDVLAYLGIEVGLEIFSWSLRAQLIKPLHLKSLENNLNSQYTAW